MQFFKSTMALCLTQLLCWQMCLAQVDPWERINVIAEGKKVAVKILSGKTVNGKMVAWTPDSLTVTQRNDKAVQLAKSDVTQVLLVTGKSRGEKAGWAFLIGGGVGGAVLAAAMRSEGSAAGFFLAGLLWFGGVAAGIAALFPAHKELIYSATPAAKP
jgi:hypothetical protein